MRVDQFVVVMIVVVTGYALETNEADRTFSIATEVKSYIHPLMLFSYVHPPCPSAYPRKWSVLWKSSMFVLLLLFLLLYSSIKYSKRNESSKEKYVCIEIKINRE